MVELFHFLATHFMNVAVSSISGAMLFYLKRISKEIIEARKEEEREQDRLKHIVVIMLRYRLVEVAKIMKKKESKTFEEWETFDVLYEDYRALGGNGLVKHLYEECEKLPFKEV